PLRPEGHQLMNASHRILLKALTVPLAVFAAGCYGPDNPKLAEAPPPAPGTPEQKAEPKGKPAGYGQGKTYQEAMERQFGGKSRAPRQPSSRRVSDRLRASDGSTPIGPTRCPVPTQTRLLALGRPLRAGVFRRRPSGPG